MVPEEISKTIGAGVRAMRSALLVLFSAASASTATAQSAVWASQLLVPAYPSPFLSEWERNPQNLTLSLAYFGSDVVDYRIEGSVRGGGLGELARAVSPTLTMTPGPTTEVFTADDLFGWNVRVNEARARQVLQTGVLPEGDYEVCVRAVNTSGIQLAESCAPFAIALPTAPQLLAPLQGGDVTATQPVFQWTPVALPPDLGVSYRVLFVPLLSGQTPLTAIRANLPIHEEVVEAPALVYPIDAVELRDGERYAWRVEALNGFGEPVLPGGLFSEIFTFTATSNRAGGGWEGEAARLPTSLDLVPGLATVTELGALEWESTPTGWIANGPAWLALGAPYNVRARIRLDDIEVERFAGVAAVRQGRARARLESPLSLDAALPISIVELAFDAIEGLRATAALTLPGGRPVPMVGEIAVTAQGLFGTLTTETRTRVPWEGGEDPVALRIEEIEVRLPLGNAVARGSATLLGGHAACDGLEAPIADDGSWNVTVLCAPEPTAARAPDVRVGIVRGAIAASFTDGGITHDLRATASLAFAPQQTSCSVRFDVLLRSGAAVDIAAATARCDAARAAVESSWLRLGFSQLEVNSLAYRPGAGFSVDARLALAPSLPAWPTFRLPNIENVRFDAAGVSLPAASLSTEQSGLDLAGYGLSAANLRSRATTISWSDWRNATLDAVSFDFDAALSLPRASQGAPICLASGMPRIVGGRLAEGQLTLDVDSSAAISAECNVALGTDLSDGLRAQVEGWVGPLVVSLHDDLALVRGLGVKATLPLNGPFTCITPSGRLELEGSLTLLPDAQLEGSAAVRDGCALSVAGISVLLRDGVLTVDQSSGAAPARLQAGLALLRDGLPVPAAGQLTVDLDHGDILEGSAALSGPLRVGLPSEAPFVEFSVDSATLSADGLAIDGRQQLRLGETESLAVTFDAVVIGLEGTALQSGRVLFDAGFAIGGRIGENGAIRWAAEPRDAPFSSDNGIRVELPARVALGADGLSVEGDGLARLRFGDRDLTDVTATFADGFRVAGAPASVASGHLALTVNGQRVAYVDASGFHADFATLAAGLVPDRIGLPQSAIAYLELRDANGDLQVRQEPHAQGLRLYTAPDSTLSLVLPALALDGADTPRVDIAVDIVVSTDPTPQLLSGTITVGVDPDERPAFDLQRNGVPFRIRTLTYTRDAGADGRWRLDGEPTLRGEPIAEAGAWLELTPESRLVGALDLPYTAAIALVPQSDVLTFTHERLRGTVDVAMPGGAGHWALSLDGQLRLDLDGQGGLAVAATLEATKNGLQFSSIHVEELPAPVYADVGALELGISAPRIPTLAWDSTGGWDFALEFDGQLRLPSLGGITTASIPSLRLTPSGISLPTLEVTDFSGSFDLEGFVVSPIALRLPAFTLDPFGGLASLPLPRLDLSIGFDDEAITRWPALSGFALSALDVELGDLGLSGSFEPRVLLNPLHLNLAPGGLAFRLGSFSGGFTLDDGAQGISVAASGQLQLPEALRCDDAPTGLLALPDASLQLDGLARLRASVTVADPTCPLRLGPLELALTETTLRLDVANASQVVDLDATAAVRLDGVEANSVVTATGSLSISLLETRVRNGSIAVDEPFRWSFPAEDPFLTLSVASAVLDTRGFVLDGSGGLLLPDGRAGPLVNVSGLTIDSDGAIVDGSATLAAGVVLDGRVVGSALDWRVSSQDAGSPDTDGLRLALGGAVRLDSAGLTLTGIANAQLRFADSVFTALSVDFTDDLRLDVANARVASGRAGLLLDGTEIAYLNSTGFFPGNLFGVLPVPARLGLPAEDVAYLQLRDPDTGALLVQTSTTAAGLSVSTASNATVQLVLPGLAGASGAATTLPVSFSLVVNPASFAVVSGSIDVQAADDAALFGLEALGLALDVTRLRYQPAQQTAPTLDLRLRLPASLSALAVELTDVAVGRNGLSGRASIGSLDPASAATPLASVTLGELSLTLRGAEAEFGQAPTLRFAGTLGSGFLADDSGVRRQVGFVAEVASDGSLSIEPDAAGVPQAQLPIGSAVLQLASVGSRPALAVIATDDLVALELSGLLRVPAITESFGVTIEGLRIGSGGISMPALTLATTAEQQSFDLFGLRFTLRDTEVGPGLALALDGRTLLLTMHGDLAAFGRSVEFESLIIGSDGRLEMGAATLVDAAIPIIPGTLAISRLAIRDRQLEADLAIDVPAPLNTTGTQTAHLRFAADGSISGGGNIILRDESAGLGGDRSQQSGLLATSHLRYIGVRVGDGLPGGGTVELVGDLYLDNEAENRVRIGNRVNGALDPGLRLSFDGSLTWGSISLAQELSIERAMVRLAVTQVSSQPTPQGLALGLNGLLQANLSNVTGGLEFADARITPDLSLSLDGIEVTGGSMSIAGFVTLSLTDYAFSETPTVIEGVRGGLMPTTSNPQLTANADNIEVESLLSFGGSVSIGNGCGSGGSCMFSGSVERVLFYTTSPANGGETRLVIRRANLQVSSALTVEADLLYRRSQESGAVEVLVGGRADLRGTELTVVGAVESGGGENRAGLFVSASTRIDLVPGVLMMSDIGGGFFYNPRPEYCQLIRQATGFNTVASNGSSCEQLGRFTGFVYGGAELVSSFIGRGAVLLTVSERGLQLEGQMALLSPGNTPVPESRIRGTLNLAIGFEEFFAEGEIALIVDHDPLLTVGGDEGPSRVGFFVYDTDAWGAYGALSISFLRLINGNAEFFVGPPGFYIDGSIYAGFDFWLIAVSGHAQAVAWLANGSWGAYLEVGISAEILGGAVSASGRLRGALVSPASSPILVYASARAQGCVLGLCGSEEVWAKFENGSVSGGFGRNNTFERVIAEARAAKASFEAERSAMESSMQTAQLLAGLSLSDAELAEAYARLREQGRGSVLADAITREYEAYPPDLRATFGTFETNLWWTTERDYYVWYRGLVEQVGSPQATMSPPLAGYEAKVTAGLQRLEDHRSIVQYKLGQTMVDIEALSEQADLSDVGESPLRATNIEAPVTVDNGDGTRTMVSGPSVEFDEAAATTLRTELTLRQQRTDAYAREVAKRIEQVEAGLAWVDFVMLDTASTSPLGFARDYATVLQDISEQYARHGDLLLRQQDWFDARLRELTTTRLPQISEYLHRKSSLLTNHPNAEAMLSFLITRRTGIIDRLTANSQLTQAFQANVQGLGDATPGLVQSYKDVADSVGKTLWYDLARAGMTTARQRIDGLFDSVRTRADIELRQRWQDHAELTMDIHRAMQARADLMAALSDLYAEYARAYPQQTTIPRTLAVDVQSTPLLTQALSKINNLNEALQVQQRRQAFSQQFTVPVVDHVVAVSQNLGYMAKETYWWEASHPSSVFEYVYNSVPAANVGFLGMLGMQSNGPQTVRESYVLTPGRGTASQQRTLRVGARGGAGYVGFARSNYETRFEGSNPSQPVGQGVAWTRTPDTTAPTTPTVRIGNHLSTVQTYWTARDDRLDSLRWNALDLESGIRGYEVAIGTLTDTTAVQDWTDVGGRTSVLFGGLTLSATEVDGYRVYVRARNGEGLLSAVGRSAPIRVDLSPPVFPDSGSIRRRVYATTMLIPVLGGTSIDPVFANASALCPLPDLFASGSTLLTYTTFPQQIPMAAAPSITLQLPRPTDEGSGTKQFAWRLSAEPQTAYQASGWTSVPGTPDTLHIAGAPLSYSDSLYLSVVAIDRVGLPSPPILYGPFVAPDPTPPVAAEFCATVGGQFNRLRLRIASPGVDAETGVLRWDYRIRREDGTVLRDWPQTPDRTTLGAGNIIETSALPLSAGDRIYAELRVTNGAGQRRISASGVFPVYLAAPSAPVIQSVSLTTIGRNRHIRLSLRTVADHSLTHRWVLRAGTSVIAAGSVSSTDGVLATVDLPARRADGSALTSGTYTLSLQSITPTGIASLQRSAQVVVP